jgi:4-amino-4-deoxy-L-arabinose transferase-like glycosyltransferase
VSIDTGDDIGYNETLITFERKEVVSEASANETAQLMKYSKPAALAACMLLIVLAFHLAVAWQDFAVLVRNGFLYDDSFYAFKIAQNIAAGRGVSFDGVHPTSGFQPLYVFLLVPAYLLSGGDPILPIHMALTMLAVFTSLTAGLIYLIARRSVGTAASLAAAAVWAFSPVVTRQGANGLETALTAFMIVLAFYFYLARVRSVERPPAWRFLALGLLLGLTVLSRIDSLLLVLVMLLDYLLLLRRSGAPSKRLVPAGLIPLGVLLLYGPWLVFNMIESGSPLQDSGTATRYLSLAYANYFNYSAENLASSGPGYSFVWTQIAHSFAVLKVVPPVHVIFRSLDRVGAAFGEIGGFRVAANVMGVVALALFAWAVARWRRDEARSRRSEIDPLLWFSGLLVASYSLYVFGSFYFIRYYYPLYIAGSLYFAFLLQDAFDWYRRRAPRARRAVAAVVAAYAALFVFFSYSQAFRSRSVYPFYDIACWVSENTGEDETIGAFQCGTIGYLSGRRIINLDGKVNRDALAALKDGCLEDYCRTEGINVVLDHERILDLFLGESRAAFGDSCATVPQGEMKHPTGWLALRISPPPEAKAAPGGAGAKSGASLKP